MAAETALVCLPNGLEPSTIAHRLGFDGAILEVPPERRDRWGPLGDRRLYHAGERQGVELLVSESGRGDLAGLRGWMLSLARQAPLRRFLHVERQASRLLVGIVRPGSFGAADCEIREYDADLERELLAIDAAGREHLALHLAERIGRDALTQRFFTAFRRHLLTLEQAWDAGVELDLDPYERRDLTLALLCRLMFVTFLAREGHLLKRRDYLRWALEQPRPGAIYPTLLKPLFFGALNTPVARRDEGVAHLGPVPFLNGGLFQPLQAELRWPALSLPDDLLAEAITELFEGHDFTAREGARKAGTRPRIDPEMLGHVFEALMHADERRQSGSFYTPAALVRELIRDVLGEAARTWGGRASEWLVAALRGEARPRLSPAEALRIDLRLAQLRVLDAAVGSGAFLLGMLEALVLLRGGLDKPLGRRSSAEWLRRCTIANNLYGVDIKSGAVRLCELRLWLSLVGDLTPGQPIQPLPNLDHRIRQGDSLREPRLGSIGWIESARTLAADAAAYGELHGPAKDTAARARQAAELVRLRGLVETARQRCLGKLDELERAAQADLFGSPARASARQRASRAELEGELAELTRAARALERSELPFFSFAAAFPEVAAQGGFDVVLGNPPWVRLHDIRPADRRLYRTRYRACGSQGSGFDNQIDLSVCFVERGLELVRPGGLLGLLLPSKLFKARYGRRLRGSLLDGHALRHWADLSLRRDRGFEASNYPAWLLIEREGGSTAVAEPARVTLDGPDGGRLSRRSPAAALSLDGRPGGPWSALPPEVLKPLATLAAGGVTLRDYGLRAALGVKTGLNRVFLAEGWEPVGEGVALAMADGSRVEVPEDLAPLALRGRDVSAFAAEGRERLLLPVERGSGQPLASVPDDVAAYFERHRDALAQRRDVSRHGRPWQVFRPQGLTPRPRVVWRDIATRLEAVYLPPEDLRVPLNTTYLFLPADPHEALVLTALLNSRWVRCMAAVLAEPAMSGYLRFLGWTVEGLPWPSRLRLNSRTAKHLEALSLLAHSEWTPAVQEEIDRRVGLAYDLSEEEQGVLAELGRFFPGLDG